MVTPILLDTNFNVIAGHGRLEALKEIGYKKIPTVILEHLTESQVRAYRLADNKTAEESEYDLDLLKVELEAISLCEDFSITDTGYDIAEVDAIIFDDYSIKKEKTDKADSIDALNIEEKVKLGDI